MQRLDPTLDIVFKLLLMQEPTLLRNMLEGVITKPIVDLMVSIAGQPDDLGVDHDIALYVGVLHSSEDMTVVELKMRSAPPPPPPPRLFAPRAGDPPVPPSVCLHWLVDPLSNTDRFHSNFGLYEQKTGQFIDDGFALHVVQLSATPPADAEGREAILARWARFFTAHDPAQLDRLAEQEPVMRTAQQVLARLSTDPEVQRKAQQRAEVIERLRRERMAGPSQG